MLTVLLSAKKTWTEDFGFASKKFVVFDVNINNNILYDVDTTYDVDIDAFFELFLILN